MIPLDHMNKLLDLLYEAKSQYHAYQKTPIVAKSDKVFVDEIERIANLIKNWCENTRIRRW